MFSVFIQQIALVELAKTNWNLLSIRYLNFKDELFSVFWGNWYRERDIVWFVIPDYYVLKMGEDVLLLDCYQTITTLLGVILEVKIDVRTDYSVVLSFNSSKIENMFAV